MELQVLDKEVSKPKFEEEPLISFVVPIYDIKADVLKRCLMSLDDQDYDNKEVICVFDGPNKELEKVVDQFPQFGKVIIEHAGACAARNAGFRESKGDIVSFFNSDYIAQPGMARLWVNSLLKNKDCGFAYGAYQYSTSKSWWYPSKPFDKDELDTANFIDCGFPLWRKYVVEWDPKCKSLQDWDFWIRVVKAHNVKGFFLGRDISFLAEPPRPKGLSDDSSHNWIDRVNYIKEKNGISKKDVVVASLGAPYHGKEIAKMIGADFKDDTIFKPAEYKALYLIGFYMKPSDATNEHSKIISHYKDLGCKIIVHFVGADIYWLRKFPYESLRYLAGALNKSCDHILSENELAQKELLEMGIVSKVVPIPPYNDYELKPLPEKFKVAFMCTDKSDFDKYCKEFTLSIVRAMPDVEFSAYGDGGQDVRLPNLKHVGNLSKDKWKEFVYDNSCLLRIVRHDTRPMASDEFILAGRDVITNIPHPFMEYIDTTGDKEINEWDMFQGGLSPERLPKTKKLIVQKIRQLKKGKLRSTRGYDSLETERRIIHMKLANDLDRKHYVETIGGFCGK